MWFDPAVVEAVRDIVPWWLGVIMVILSYLGSVYLIAPAAIAAYWRSRDTVAPMLGGIIGCYGLMSITKSHHDIVHRPEIAPPVDASHFPSWFEPLYTHAAHIETSTFPSGHAMAATIIIGMLVMDLDIWTFPKRLLAGIGIIGWVSFTRLGLGVHFLGDVIGGIAYGLAFLGVFYTIRYYAADETLAVLGLGLIAGLVAVFVTSGYTFTDGSRNAHFVFGSGIGAVLSWYYAPELSTWVERMIPPFAVPAMAVVATLGVWGIAELGLVNRFVMVGFAAIFLMSIILVPWVIRPDEFIPRALSPSRSD